MLNVHIRAVQIGAVIWHAQAKVQAHSAARGRDLHHLRKRSYAARQPIKRPILGGSAEVRPANGCVERKEPSESATIF